MSDKANVHPFHLPDESAIIRGEGESGIKMKWDATFHQEDLDEESIQNPDRTKGGGRNVVDMAEENRTMDPEYLILRDEYNDREKGDKRSFQDWAGDQPQHNEIREKRKDWAIKIDLDKLEGEYESSEYQRLADLMKIWSKPDTKVTFRFGEKKEDDKIVFEGSAEYNDYAKRPRNMRVAIKKEDFNQLIKANGRDLEIRRPRGDDDRNSVMFVLEHVRFHQSGFKGKEFNVVFPDIELKSDLQHSLKKLMSDEFDATKQFLEDWKDPKITDVEVMFKDDKFRGVSLRKSDGSQSIVSALELRSLVPQIWRKDVGNREGISILAPEGQVVLTSEASEEKIGKILKRIKIDGVKLPESVHVKKNEVYTADLKSEKYVV